MHNDRKLLLKSLPFIRRFLNNDLDLILHPNKVYIQYYYKGVNFLGACIKPYRCYVHNRIIRNFNRQVIFFDLLHKKNTHVSFNEIMCSYRIINSYLGIMSHFNTYNIKWKVLFKKHHELFRYGYITRRLKSFKLKKRV